MPAPARTAATAPHRSEHRRARGLRPYERVIQPVTARS